MEHLAPPTSNPITPRQLEEHRTALTGHCYRMLASATEADDAVQETMLRAIRRLDQFEGRSSLRTWLYRIATRVCLDAIDERKRRARPMDLRPVGNVDEELLALPGDRWIEPIPDAQALPTDANPAELVAMRQSIRLAFIAALQHLPPKQRAVLLLTEVLDWPAADVAACLETSVAAVNSALQRARATIGSKELDGLHAPLSEPKAALLQRYVEAFERYDMDALAAVLREDATMCMPPFDLWLQGQQSIRDWMLGRGIACNGSRLVPTAACGLPAFGQYKPAPGGGPHQPWSLVVLEVDGDRIGTLHHFLDTQTLFPRFGLPMELSADR
ncbi:sigma-70 family RNA polymerase sigma factor [Vulgatibacter sp.]|uniref:sigma-70 family RNA polymerase sigma factor n=1 Tax=Vulgatibacter sp. TaxID=1971226 RepID=UPI00356A5F72